jgi:hypothetical protein
MNSGSDEFTESEDIIFRIKKYELGNFDLVLDGKHWKMTPIQYK